MSAEHLDYLEQEFNKIDDPVQLMAVALGAASACWEKIEDAGEYQPERVTDILAALCARMNALAQERLDDMVKGYVLLEVKE